MSDDRLAAVRTALDAAREERFTDLNRLDAAVREYGRVARRESISPEQMLVALVSVIREATQASVSDWWSRLLRDRVVRDAIEAYYSIALSDPN